MPHYNKFVLLVDDNPTDLFLFKRLLEKASFKVMATSEADTAMSLIVAGEVGCLVTDQMMPVTGQELVTYVRGARSDIGVVFLSGADNPREDLPPGVFFISKDKKQQLVETVRTCMQKFQMN